MSQTRTWQLIDVS